MGHSCFNYKGFNRFVNIVNGIAKKRTIIIFNNY